MEENKNKREPKNEDKSDGIVLKKSHIAVLLVLLLLLVFGGVFVGLRWGDWFGSEVDTSRTGSLGPDIDPGAADWSKSELSDAGGETSGIAIPGYPAIKLPAGERNVQVVLLNPEGNPCYFSFEIVLTDTGESIYESKMVPPGQAVKDLTLTRALESGEYKALIKIKTFALEGLGAMNGADVKTTLIVE